MNAMGYTVFGLIVTLGVACDTKEKEQPSSGTTRTRSAITVAAKKSLTASECEATDKRNEPGCDWYYDPMRTSAATDAPR